MRKIINIVVIFMIVIIVSSQLAYASEGVCLRVPITRDANREKEVLLKIQRREIKEKLAKLSVIKDKKPEEITEKDKEYLVEVAAYFNLWPEYLTKRPIRLFNSIIYFNFSRTEVLGYSDSKFTFYFISHRSDRHRILFARVGTYIQGYR
jgi:hypothetical protein